MRILLIQPAMPKRAVSLGKLEPLSLEILAGAVPEHDVRIVDYRFDKDLDKAIRDFKPDVVGVTALTLEYNSAVSIIKAVSSMSKSIRIVVGGHHASLRPEDFNMPEVHAIALGLGHTTFRELIGAYVSDKDIRTVSGLAIPDNGVLHFTPKRPAEADIHNIPKPKRSLTKQYWGKYRIAFYPVRCGVTYSSLGCTNRCLFCSAWKANGGKYLELEAEEVVKDIMGLEQDLVLIADDNFLSNPERAWAFERILRKQEKKKRLAAYCRADTIANNPDLMRSLKECGLFALVVGLEAVTNEQLRKFNKTTTVEINRKAIQCLTELGIKIEGHFVLSHEYGKEDFDMIAKFIDETGLWTPRFSVLTPLPGTDLYEKVKGDLLTKNYDYFDLAHVLLPPTKAPYLEHMRRGGWMLVRTMSPLRYARDILREMRHLLRHGKLPMTDRRTSMSLPYYLISASIYAMYLLYIELDGRQIAKRMSSKSN